MKKEIEITQETAQAHGYDWAVVQYFLRNRKLLEFMWGNSSAHYTAILQGEADRDGMLRTLAMLHSEGYTAQSARLMIEYLNDHPEVEHANDRPETE